MFQVQRKIALTLTIHMLLWAFTCPCTGQANWDRKIIHSAFALCRCLLPGSDRHTGCSWNTWHTRKQRDPGDPPDLKVKRDWVFPDRKGTWEIMVWKEIKVSREFKDYQESSVRRVTTERRANREKGDYLEKLSCLHQHRPSIVAFSAVRVTKLNENGGGEIAAFGDVMTNIGDGYDSQSGVFTCPIHGLYFFTVSLLSLNNPTGMYHQLRKNGELIVSVFDNHPGFHHQASQSAILELTTGDRVWIQSGGANRGFYSSINRHSSFSGFLINAMQ